MSYQITYSTIRHIINGEVIDAQVLNRPILDLTNRTNAELDNLYNYTNDTFFRNDGGVIDGEVEVTGNTHFGKDVTVSGNFFVKGQTTQVDNRISTGDVKMTLNFGEQGDGVTAGFSGIEIDRGSLANFVFGFDEDNDVFAIGKGTGNLQPLTTRELEPHPNGTMVWDAGNKRLKSYTDVDYRQLINVRQHGTGSTQVRDNAQNDGRFLRRSRNLDDLSDIDSAREVLRIEKLDNTADEDKPISNATQAALNTKADKTVAVSAGSGLTGGGNLGGNFVIRMGEPSDVAISSENSTSGNSHSHRLVLSPADINLGNVDNTSDVDKPVSTAQQTALNMKVDKTTRITAGSGLTGGGLLSADRAVNLGTPSTITISTENSVTDSTHTHEININAADINLGNVDNTSDVDKPVSTAQQSALDEKVDKRDGYALSQNDFTDQRLGKLNSIETGAQVNRSITVERDRTTTGTTLDAVAIRDHIQSSDHDFRYYTKTQIDDTVDGLEDSISTTNQNISDNYVPRILELNAGDGLSGGGSLEQSRTISVNSTVLRTNAEQTIISPKTFTAATRYQTAIGNYTIQQGTSNLGTVSFNSRDGNAVWYFDTNEIDLLEFRSHSGGANYHTDFEMNFSSGEFKAPKFVGDGSNLTSLQTSELTGTISYNNLPISATNVSNWNTAYAERGSQIAGTGLSWSSGNLNVQYGNSAGTAAQGNDPRLSDAREWTAATVSESEARAGAATTRRAWTSQRVRQNVQEFVENYTDSFDTNGDYSGLRARATTAADVGLGNVDNTSDANKPVSTAQQAALDLKVDRTRTISTGDGINGGGNLSANRTFSVDNTVARRNSDNIFSGTNVFEISNFDAAEFRLFRNSGTNSGDINLNFNWGEFWITPSESDAGSGIGISSNGNVGINARPSSSLALNVGGDISASNLNISNWNTAFSWGDHASAGYTPQSRTITTGDGLSGGGNLSSNRTLSVDSSVARYGTDGNQVRTNSQLDGRYVQPNDLGSAASLDAGSANGVATLDSAGKVPLSQMSDTVLGQVEYMGTWNASTNTPTLPNTPSKKGDYYVVSTGGTFAGIDFAQGDWIISKGNSWERVANTDAVTSVNGKIGSVVLNSSDVGAVPTGRTITTGDGLSGGGNLSSNRTLSVDSSVARYGTDGNQVRTNSQLDARYSQIDTTYSAGTGLTLSGTTFSVSNPFNPSGDYSGLRARGTTAADVGAVPTSRTLTAGNGLTGGGALNTNRTIEVDFDVLDERYVTSSGNTVFNADGTYPNLRAQGTTAADVGAPPTSRTINITTGGGLSGGATQSLASNRTWNLSVDSTVVRTSGAQTIGGAKKFTSRLTVENGSYEQHLELIRNSIVARINPSTGNNSGVSNELRFEGTNVNGYWFDGRVAAEDGFYGTGSGITSLNASNLSSGTVPTARLPSAALVGDTTYSAGTGLSLSGTTFSVTNPFNPSGNYASLRARGTTKADVGLGSVRNVASYSQSESDGRYARNNGDSLTGRYRINTTDDGTSDLQVGGDTSLLGNVGIGNRNPSEGLDIEGDVRVRDEGAVKFGGTGGTSASVSIQFNEATQSIDFNFI